MKIKLRHCKEVDKDHERSCRQYAHTYHYKNTICVAKKFYDLPYKNQAGLVAHEIGHLLVGNVDHKERVADVLANAFFGIKIKYSNSKYGKRLQYLSKPDTHKVIMM